MLVRNDTDNTLSDGSLEACKNPVKVPKDTKGFNCDVKTPATGVQARFTNEFDPLYAKPYVRYTLNTGRYLNDELCGLLEEDRRKSLKHRMQCVRKEQFTVPL